ncbi:hypothetical protein AC579_1872 [Pseudocercospora musae]|uniref:Uncharacterized protein n=1 Tax=Pseudocercospora musae TaxID=113226 RepID=A0A139IBS5_9PEZI|nr:hypothetical protein AC579_1872 [Pseudocercospora musae]
MTMADEALKSIEFLLERVPCWIADLEAIIKSAAETQGEILFTCQPAEQAISIPKRDSKTSSLKSKRSSKVGHQEDRLRPQLPHLTNSDALRLSQRKRKTASVCSGSGPPRFRNKASAVVFYDGDTQRSFERLVRAVGTARNAMRKGKMSAKVDALSRASSRSSGASISSGEDESEYNPTMAGLNYRSTRARARARAPPSNRDDGSEGFDKVDGQLEKAQLLCERAAHQILRDGDCTLEMSNAKEHFSAALALAQAEVPVLREKAQEAAVRQRRNDEGRRLAEEAEKREFAADVWNDQVQNIGVNVAFPSPGTVQVDELEVDDGSDDDDGDVDIEHLRFGTFAHMRSTRLAVH